MVERKAFLANQSIHIMYPNVENMVVVPNEKNIDHNEHPSLSHFTDEH